MLKTRIIGVVLVKNNIAVQSIQFKHYLPIGKPEIAIRYLDQWGIDEIVVLNLDGVKSNVPFASDQIKLFARHCHVPLTIGGGIREIKHVSNIIRAGADKVMLNSVLEYAPQLIADSGSLFGQQSVIASIDSKVDRSGLKTAHFQGGKIDSSITVTDFAKKMQMQGAGEILLTSIEHDGMKAGYDFDLIESVSTQINIPVIACGGAGHPIHAYDAVTRGISAVAIGNYFHFTEHSVTLLKRYLATLKSAVRSDYHITYNKHILSNNGRLTKPTDDFLESLRFQYIPEEII